MYDIDHIGNLEKFVFTERRGAWNFGDEVVNAVCDGADIADKGLSSACQKKRDCRSRESSMRVTY